MGAVITGGAIIQIKLFPNGAGLCTTQGGSEFLIKFMGYSGAILWGAGIYLMASSHRQAAKILSAAIMFMLVISLIFWVRDLLTPIIVVLLLALFYWQWRAQHSYAKEVMQITGLLVLLNALLSPLHLLDGRHIGDGAALSQITFIPEFFWVIIWSTLAGIVLWLLRKK